MNTLLSILFSSTLSLLWLSASPAGAQTSTESTSTSALTYKVSHESEVSTVITSGNTSSETYQGKQTTKLTQDKNSVEAMGRFLRSLTQGNETAKNWAARLRVDRSLTDRADAFVAHQAESDFFAGTVQRNSTDVGGKYHFLKEDRHQFFGEFGYRNSFEQRTPGFSNLTLHNARLYLEAAQKWNESLSTKLWVEYIPSITESENWQTNFEPSLTSLLSQVFSLKVSYLGRYNNKPASDSLKKLDTLFTLAVVAKF